MDDAVTLTRPDTSPNIGLMEANARRIILAEQDVTRLRRLVEQYAAGRNAETCEALEAELDRADVVEPARIPPEVATMGSRVRYIDERTGEEREVTLVYPFQADVSEGRVSVLAPVGAALLGLAVGQSIEWPMPGGATKRLRLTQVLYQPEAAADFQA